MKKKLTTVAFQGTKEQEEKLLAVIEKHAGQRGAMMPILQEAQEIYGYLPIEVQTIIAEKTGVSMEEIFGIISFYAQFKLNPDGQYAIAVCLGTACYVKGSGDIIEAISQKLNVPVGSTSPDGKYSIEATRCIGACGLAPVLTVNGEVYGKITVDDVDSILAKYR
ncbi:MAG: NAD(P)H-dependent oxidoreductase subunit E [Clostridia bacterium]|nr:NAD(P)H-dependent oxidoreductase subunit E [Clostridia bacterium]MBQ2249039.1 NAD(P)H-dependent oxidoreductase subunit E [Clostridia bacterium]MBQ5612816.1 NAD(P)H-dependent oxidoreductase subunit E [Clostridia bacterium]MBQ5662200.1 NAD(P)H-dependent oxidoreductase subunit E [Clostridia bacterium]MBQ5772031.1 NAD(P)H-dependent oxidoreductase subunit E [Clostridia bacterium]